MSTILAMIAVLTVGTADAQLNVFGELAHDLSVAPGAMVEREIVVENLGDERMTARIYQTDYSFSADGTNAFDVPGTLPRSNAGWIVFEPSIIVIEPGRKETLRFRVNVPAQLPDSLSAGSFWSMLMIEGVARDALAAPTEGQIGLQQITRFGIQIATHIGEGTPAIEFSNASLETTEDGPVLHIDLVNSGDLFLRPGLSLRIVDESGREFGPYASDAKRMYPGTSVRHIIPITEIPPGSYSALLIADNGDANVFGASLKLTL